MAELTRIQGYAHIAAQYGLEEAIFMDTIVHWYRENRANDRNFHEGRYWTYNTIKAFTQTFPWWTPKQLRRIITSCKEKGALLSCTNNKQARDRTLWYSPSDEILALYGDSQMGKSNCPNGQMGAPERANGNAQTGKALPCNTHVDTQEPPYNPPTEEKKSKYDLDDEAKRLLNEYVMGDRELTEAMKDMMDTRRELKASGSARAIKSFLSELDAQSYGSRRNKLALLRRAVAAGWKVTYAMKPWELPDPPIESGQAPSGYVIEEEGTYYL